MSLSNVELFNRKRDLISNCSFPMLHFFRLNVRIHGLAISLFFSSCKIFEYLRGQLPSTWCGNFTTHLSLYFYGQEEFDSISWGEEESSNCFLEWKAGFELAIQRDFVGLEGLDNRYDIILSEDIHNGFFNALRWILPRKIVALDRVILHSSVVITPEGEANIFLGHSGAGKTTITKLAEDRLVLGDDMNLLFKKGDEYYIQAGGLGGRSNNLIVADDIYSIKGFYWIKQARSASLEEMESSTAALKLIGSCPNLFLNYNTTTFIANQVMKLATSVAEKYFFGTLNFSLNREFLSYVER